MELNCNELMLKIYLKGSNTLKNETIFQRKIDLNNVDDSGSKNAGILFRFPHLFLYLNGCRRFSVTIMAIMQIFDGCRRPFATIENLVPTHIMQISMVAENLLQPSDGYRKPSATVKIRKQIRKPKQNTSVFFTHGWLRKLSLIVQRLVKMEEK